MGVNIYPIRLVVFLVNLLLVLHAAGKYLRHTLAIFSGASI
jgi:hypothetical protein